MRKTFVIFLVLGISLIFNCSKVNAQADNYYINQENVKIQYDLYEELCEIYSKSYVEFIDQDKFDLIKNNDISKVEIIDNEENLFIVPYSTVFTTTYKRIRIVKNGSLITLQLTWLNLPATRSYDVMGIRFDGVSLSGTPTFSQTYMQDGTYKRNSTNYLQSFSNGFGTSFLLPSGTISDLTQSIDFFYNGRGRIYGSYQHAQKSISLTNSKKYTISHTGYGNVIEFDSNIKSYYDAMSGVYIDI